MMYSVQTAPSELSDKGLSIADLKSEHIKPLIPHLQGVVFLSEIRNVSHPF